MKGLIRRAELVCFGAGFLLLGLCAAAWTHRTLLSRASLRAFAAARGEIGGAALADSAGKRAGSIDTSLWSPKRIREYEASLRARAWAPLGVLAIPKLRLEVPVPPGTDDLTLNRGVGHIDSTALPGSAGNIGIAGHRDGFFRGLKDIAVGDHLDLVTTKGTDSYRIDDIRIVPPEDVSVLRENGRPTVTLVTCYPFYFVGDAPMRYIVRATKLDAGR